MMVTFLTIFFELLAGLGENSTIKQLDIRLTGVAKQVNIAFNCHWPTTNISRGVYLTMLTVQTQ